MGSRRCFPSSRDRAEASAVAADAPGIRAPVCCSHRNPNIDPSGNVPTQGESRFDPRTIGTGRLEAFSDGVIAVIITILVLELARPVLTGVIQMPY